MSKIIQYLPKTPVQAAQKPGYQSAIDKQKKRYIHRSKRQNHELLYNCLSFYHFIQRQLRAKTR